jgi:molybdopterin converting factor small subunit
MGIKINLHATHRSHADGLAVVETEGNTVGDCLDDLIAQYPRLKEKLFDSNGKLRNTIDIYLNLESTYPEELKKRVKPGDEIHLTILLAGG